MTEEKIQELMYKLKDLTYYSNVLGERHIFPVINKNNYDKVEATIRQFLLDNHDGEYGELQAKVYAYEKIIANSNFAPMVIKKPITKDIGDAVEINLDSVIKQNYIEREVLDKIRAEIEELTDDLYHSDEYADGYNEGAKDSLKIIDKYKAESEDGACKDCYYNDGEVHAECVICDKTKSEVSDNGNR